MSPRNNRMPQYEQGTATKDRPGTVGQAYQRSEELVCNNPAASALITFGLGFGVGLLLTSLLSPPRRRPSGWRSWYDSRVPHWATRDSLSDTVSRVLPEALARRM